MQLHSIARPSNSIPLEPFLQAADILVRCDEPLRALALLDNLPGSLREQEPAEVVALRSTIHQRLSTQGRPSGDGKARTALAGPAAQRCLNTPIGRLHVATTQVANERGRQPHVVEVDAQDGWLPIGLQAIGCRFSYVGFGRHGVDSVRQAVGAAWSDQPREGQPVLFSIGTAVQQVLDLQEIAFMARGLPREPDYVIVGSSTESGTGTTSALRRFTPRELRSWCERTFPKHSLHVESTGSEVVILGELGQNHR